MSVPPPPRAILSPGGVPRVPLPRGDRKWGTSSEGLKYGLFFLGGGTPPWHSDNAGGGRGGIVSLSPGVTSPPGGHSWGDHCPLCGGDSTGGVGGVTHSPSPPHCAPPPQELWGDSRGPHGSRCPPGGGTPCCPPVGPHGGDGDEGHSAEPRPHTMGGSEPYGCPASSCATAWPVLWGGDTAPTAPPRPYDPHTSPPTSPLSLPHVPTVSLYHPHTPSCP